ncbi:MAG: YchJ family metal-binding protein [Thiomicrorhabdus sp.]|nr:YchJ family metal-binding protein [Thiomicrorhabdus sp.]
MPIDSQLLDNQLCLCGSNKEYGLCCKPFHLNQCYPETAEALMRSRFTAFELHLKEYLLASWHPTTRPADLEFTPNMHWTRLVINGRKKGRRKDSQGWVTFVAYFTFENEQGYLHETSYFERGDLNRWYYVDGEIK